LGKALSNSIQVADEKDGWKERRKREREWDKKQREYERESAKDYREREREERKHYEEQEREARKHHQEMRRERRKHREEIERGYRKESRYGGPPPWARARGWRRKQERRVRYHHHDRDRYATVADAVRLPESGLGQCNREVVGGLLGAAAGGFLGSKIGSGSGKTAAVIGGTIVGVLVGGNIGRSMDRIDQNCVGQALERAPKGQTVIWNNPDQNREYQVTPTRTYQTESGSYCREYQTKIIIDGRVERAHGTACRQADGTWKKT
jgi:surface antigen